MAGVRVVEIGIWVAAPSAGGILADWGADVVKIESPAGDPLRGVQDILGTPANPYFEPDNRAKRSIVLDLRQPDDRALALELIDGADVLLTNLRPAGLARLGLDHETLLARHPRLIYALVTGYGLEGPDAAAGAYDMGAFWARGGIADALSLPGEHLPTQRSGMGDHLTGVTVAGAVGAALFSREKTGRGQLVSTSLLRAATYFLNSDFNAQLMVDLDVGYTDRTTTRNPLWNHYTASDGKSFWLIGVEADRHWPSLLRILDRPEWGEDERFATRVGREQHAAELIALVDAEFAAHPRAVWAQRFDAEPDFFWARVNSVADAIVDPQTAASGAFVEVADGSYDRPMIASPVDFHGTPWNVRTRAPRLGQHSAEIRAELAAARAGLSPDVSTAAGASA
jgi:crotonobetainyl-CoA:carnitine CoA-transferase CaiB-like acyl-CoA transferase